MNYCEKYSGLLRTLESVEVRTKGPCHKYFVECELNDLLRHAGAYTTLSLEHNEQTAEEFVVCHYQHSGEDRIEKIPVTDARGLLAIAYLVLSHEIFGTALINEDIKGWLYAGGANE